jgi:serine/threonine protein phosphatase 1
MFGLFNGERSGPRGLKGRRAYAVGDIHGRLDLLDELLAKIERDLASSKRRIRANLIFLGDLIDRGPSSAQVVERLRTYVHRNVQPVFLLGNH